MDIEELSKYSVIKSEYGYGHTRFDFILTNERTRCLLEVKLCTLVKDGIAMFPDAPTKRGRRQIKDLVRAKKKGYETCMLFIVQRTDAQVFTPNEKPDPELGKVLRDATLEGVDVYAYKSQFIENKITLKEKIKVEL